MNRCVRALCGLAMLVAATPAMAQSMIRDAEIEATIRTISDPLFSAGHLNPEDVHVYILNDDKLNAFVAGGQNLFLNTGLLLRTENPGQLAGVIAHETGHMAGGHLSRGRQQQEQSMASSVIGMLLGAAAAVAGAPQVGTALMAGGLTWGQQSFLKFSRAQETYADQAAVTYLAAERESPRGLLEFFKILETQNLRISGGGSPYLRTHPLTSERIEFMTRQVEISPYRNVKDDPELVERHARMVAKLDGFLSDPDEALRRYQGDRLVDHYARSIAYHRKADTKRALAEVDELIALRPDDPYFWELKGQILFESGKPGDAVGPYEKAVKLQPDSSLLRLGLARALLEGGKQADVPQAVSLLREAVRIEPENPGLWQFLGIALGRDGQQGEATLALAERAVRTGNKRDAELYVSRAEQLVGPNDPGWIQLQDLERTVADMEEPPREARRQ